AGVIDGSEPAAVLRLHQRLHLRLAEKRAPKNVGAIRGADLRALGGNDPSHPRQLRGVGGDGVVMAAGGEDDLEPGIRQAGERRAVLAADGRVRTNKGAIKIEGGEPQVWTGSACVHTPPASLPRPDHSNGKISSP